MMSLPMSEELARLGLQLESFDLIEVSTRRRHIFEKFGIGVRKVRPLAFGFRQAHKFVFLGFVK